MFMGFVFYYINDDYGFFFVVIVFVVFQLGLFYNFRDQFGSSQVGVSVVLVFVEVYGSIGFNMLYLMIVGSVEKDSEK